VLDFCQIEVVYHFHVILSIKMSFHICEQHDRKVAANSAAIPLPTRVYCSKIQLFVRPAKAIQSIDFSRIYA